MCKLVYALKRKLGKLEMGSFVQSLLVLIPAALLAGGLAWYGHAAWESRVGHATLLTKIAAVFAPALAVALAYWLVAVWARIPAATDIAALLRKRFR